MAEARSESWSELNRWLDWAVDLDKQTRIDHCRQYIKDQIAAFDARTALEFKIVLRESQSFAGQIGLYNIDWSIGKFTVGYWVRSTCTGRGIATEATNALTRYAFGQLGAHGVGLGALDENLASIRVIEKLNFELIDRWPDTYHRKDGQSGSSLIYRHSSTTLLPSLDVRWGD